MNKLLTTIVLIIASIIGGARSQPAKSEVTSETQLMLSVINERITVLNDEIPKIQKRLIQSRKDYKRLLEKVPKGYELICGDSVSSALADQLTKYSEDIKSLQREKNKIEGLAKKTKTEQDAAANP